MAEDSNTVRQQMLELRKRVVRADRALACCRGESQRMQIDVLGILNQVLGFMQDHHRGQDLALVPVVGLLPGSVEIETFTGFTTRLVVVEAGAPLAVGAVALGVAAALDFIAETKAAYEVWSVINTAIGQQLANRKGSCYACLKKNLLSQTHPRHREKSSILRRV